MSSTPPEKQEACSSCNGWWRLPLLLAIVLGSIVALRGGLLDENSQLPIRSRSTADNPTDETVSLAVDFGNGTVREFPDLAWHDSMTVADALAVASNVENGPRFAYQGAGKMAFLTELGGERNEGAGGRNWMYAVNGKRADRSFAVYELQPGDRILWSFGAPR